MMFATVLSGTMDSGQNVVLVESREERRAYDFNSLWTSLVAMMSAMLGMFAFFFKNVLPKRYFIGGTKGFAETQDQFLESPTFMNMVRMVSLNEPVRGEELPAEC